MLWASKIERKKNASGQLVPLDVDGFVDEGIVVLTSGPVRCEIAPRLGNEALSLLAQERELRGL
ncbi:hypothetical protein BGY98DRAFT_1093255 [Russula aff. rugulosa BPL654]|nr:hypothetical protein BGY98DRAFT_1093255 [Russula aff. rugulosa BPL654]